MAHSLVVRGESGHSDQHSQRVPSHSGLGKKVAVLRGQCAEGSNRFVELAARQGDAQSLVEEN